MCFLLQGFFVALIFCFLNSEVGSIFLMPLFYKLTVHAPRPTSLVLNPPPPPCPSGEDEDAVTHVTPAGDTPLEPFIGVGENSTPPLPHRSSAGARAAEEVVLHGQERSPLGLRPGHAPSPGQHDEEP